MIELEAYRQERFVLLAKLIGLGWDPRELTYDNGWHICEKLTNGEVLCQFIGNTQKDAIRLLG